MQKRTESGSPVVILDTVHFHRVFLGGQAWIDKPGQSDPETKKPLFYYAHPIFWAFFNLVGDGGAAGAS